MVAVWSKFYFYIPWKIILKIDINLKYTELNVSDINYYQDNFFSARIFIVFVLSLTSFHDASQHLHTFALQRVPY